MQLPQRTGIDYPASFCGDVTTPIGLSSPLTAPQWQAAKRRCCEDCDSTPLCETFDLYIKLSEERNGILQAGKSPSSSSTDSSSASSSQHSRVSSSSSFITNCTSSSSHPGTLLTLVLPGLQWASRFDDGIANKINRLPLMLKPRGGGIKSGKGYFCTGPGVFQKLKHANSFPITIMPGLRCQSVRESVPEATIEWRLRRIPK
ncbi:hypothetical protein EDC04DRAFT_2600644 [Pisolithus marmoratus]|nr:hypothetical protein EDC04DRAFT_2600644 [Pisolithus marmoratus]